MNRSKPVDLPVEMDFMPKHETPPEQTGAISGLEFAQPEEFSKRTAERRGYGTKEPDVPAMHSTSDEYHHSSGAPSANPTEAESYDKKYTKFSKNALPYDFPPEFSEPPPAGYDRRHHQSSMGDRSRKRYQERDHYGYGGRYDRDPHRDPRVYNEERLRYERRVEEELRRK